MMGKMLATKTVKTQCNDEDANGKEGQVRKMLMLNMQVKITVRRWMDPTSISENIEKNVGDQKQ